MAVRLLVMSSCAGCVPEASDDAPDLPVVASEGDVAAPDEVVPRLPVWTWAGLDCRRPERRAKAWYTSENLPTAPVDVQWVSGAGVAVGDVMLGRRLEIVAVTADDVFLFRHAYDPGDGSTAGRPGTGTGTDDDPGPDPWTRETLLHVDHALPAGVAPTFRDAIRMFHGATLVDDDGDGDLDIFVTGNHVPNVLLRNDAGTFHDVAAEVGLAGEGLASLGASWADMDLDGDLDVAVPGHGDFLYNGVGEFDLYPHPTKLYEQRDGVFVDVSDRLDTRLDGALAMQILWHDFDGDGLPDLYVATDLGEKHVPPRLLRNTGDRFVLDEGREDLQPRVTGMGLAASDLEQDGVVDLVLAGFERFAVLTSHDGAWVDASAAWGPRFTPWQVVPWGVEAFDADNDGDLDLFSGFGNLKAPDGSLLPRMGVDPTADVMYERVAPTRFERLRAGEGLDDLGSTRGVIVADLDRDGWQDIVRARLGGYVAVAQARCGQDAWLRVVPRQADLNTHAIGARVMVEVDGVQRVAWIRAGGTGYASGGPPEANFGLGDVDRVDRVEVTWPDGEVDEVRDVETRRELLVRRRPHRH